jgi:hypothetical protein
LSLDAKPSGETKRVPGFATESAAAEADSDTPAREEGKATGWSSAPPPSEKATAGDGTLTPGKWNSGTMMKGLAIVVLGALSVYFIRRRLL